MPRAVLLQCPICNAVRTIAGTRDDHSDGELLARAKAHVADHTVDENKAGIRKHQIATEAEEIIVSAADFDRLPGVEWQPATETWLPDGVTSARSIGDDAEVVDAPSSPTHNAQD